MSDENPTVSVMPEFIIKRFYISGCVQGVFFRASTRTKAIELGIRGYARNLTDGRVEVLAIGTPNAVEKLNHWLWIGPEEAHVEKVVTQVVTMDELSKIPNGFSRE